VNKDFQSRSSCLRDKLQWPGVDVQGYHGIEEEVFLSMPVVVGENGINAIFNQKLDDDEVAKIKKSAWTLRDVINRISI